MKADTTYEGDRDPMGRALVWVDGNKPLLPLRLRAGAFEWGIGPPATLGERELAVALMSHVLVEYVREPLVWSVPTFDGGNVPVSPRALAAERFVATHLCVLFPIEKWVVSVRSILHAIHHAERAFPRQEQETDG